MNPIPFSALALLFFASGCNDNSEDITIRPDGSATVALTVEGDTTDVADGYPIPLQAPWIAADAPTLEWLRVVGPDTGSASVRANAANLDKRSPVFQRENNVRLSVHADFRTVADIPQLYAPESEPYRTAFLLRKSELSIERKGSRTIYTFERRYGARDWRRFDLGSLLRRNSTEDLWKRIEQGMRLTNEERTQVLRAAETAVWGSMMSFANAGIESLFVHGDASLPIAAVERIRGRVHDALVQCAPSARIERIVARAFPSDGSKGTGPADEDAKLERELRETLRNALNRALEAESVPLPMRNAVMGELEWHLAAYDSSSDLSDETFEVSIRMPGTIVGGNAEELRGSAASWKFNGKDLHEREFVLRAVSVLE